MDGSKPCDLAHDFKRESGKILAEVRKELPAVVDHFLPYGRVDLQPGSSCGVQMFLADPHLQIHRSCRPLTTSPCSSSPDRFFLGLVGLKTTGVTADDRL